MKTTVDIPNDLVRKVKLVAALEGTTMRALMTRALETELERHGEGGDAPVPKWRSAFGKLSYLRSESERIDDAVESAFEEIDEEMWNDA